MALWEAIRDAPNDDSPRLVYADLLEEQGDLDRAHFIRLQCRLASLPVFAPEADAIRWRCRVLLAEHGRAWLAELPHPPGVHYTHFERGFAAGVTVRDPRQWAEHRDLITAHAPVHALTLDLGDHTPANLDLSGLTHLRLQSTVLLPGRLLEAHTLRGLDLSGARLDPSDLTALTTLPLEHLDLRGFVPPPEAIRALASGLNRLRTLVLHPYQSDTPLLTFAPWLHACEHLDALSIPAVDVRDTPLPTGLRSLSLAQAHHVPEDALLPLHQLTQLDLTALVDPHPPAIPTTVRVVDLSHTQADATALLPLRPTLESLSWRRRSGSLPDGLFPSTWPRLHSLELEGHRMSGPQLAALAGSSFPRLRALNLNSVSPTGLSPLTKGSWNPGLEHLQVAMNGLHDAGLAALLACFPQLQTLEAGWNDTLLCVPASPSLRILQLERTRCGEDLSRLPERLLHLTLTEASLADAQCRHLLRAGGLRELQVGGNALGDGLVAAVERGLPALTHLDVAEALDDEALERLLDQSARFLEFLPGRTLSTALVAKLPEPVPVDPSWR